VFAFCCGLGSSMANRLLMWKLRRRDDQQGRQWSELGTVDSVSAGASHTGAEFIHRGDESTHIFVSDERDQHACSSQHRTSFAADDATASSLIPTCVDADMAAPSFRPRSRTHGQATAIVALPHARARLIGTVPRSRTAPSGGQFSDANMVVRMRSVCAGSLGSSLPMSWPVPKLAPKLLALLYPSARKNLSQKTLSHKAHCDNC
jgi:hypothetical protein